MFSMTMKYDARDVGRRDISLEIVAENIDTMGDDTCQFRKGETLWNQHILLTGTTTSWIVQDFRQKVESRQRSSITSMPNIQVPPNSGFPQRSGPAQKVMIQIQPVVHQVWDPWTVRGG